MKRVAAPPRVAAAITLALAFVLALFSAPAAADQTAPKQATCEESLPKGAKRPKVKEKFPGEAIAGFEVPLELEIRHGKGEVPLPNGFKIVSGSTSGKYLEESGFILAEPNGGITKVTEEDGNAAVTRVTIPFVVTPNKSGDQSQTLPQMPFTIDRANGDTITLCTKLHLITVKDPTAGEEDPKPRANAPGRTQREEWLLPMYLMIALGVLLLLATLIAWWVRRQLRKAIPSAVPTRQLPWETALVELQAHAASPLLDASADAGDKRTELFDKVSDTLRKYLGARYGFEGLGFDGLETTTDEMLALLKRVRPTVPSLDLVKTFLTECDLVKFARVVPEVNDCSLAIQRAETVVRSTIPIAVPAPGADPKDGGPPAPPPAAFTPPPRPAEPRQEPRA